MGNQEKDYVLTSLETQYLTLYGIYENLQAKKFLDTLFGILGYEIWVKKIFLFSLLSISTKL